MGQYNSTLRWTSPFADDKATSAGPFSGIKDDEIEDQYDMARPPQSTSSSPSNTSLMGNHAPIMYEAALVGNWREILQRVQTHPLEVLYQDKCKNTALHLACRRQPPANVIAALLRADSGALSLSNYSNNNNNNVNGGRKTVDGLTPLHFACYCGASEQVIDLLLSYKESTLHHSTSSSHNNLSSLGYSSKSLSKRNKLLDKRGRTPLHCACAGFRTKHRPAVVQLLLRSDPSWATVKDEKGRTPFTLMYADYAEEIEDILDPSVSTQQARDACWIDDPPHELNELWKILCLLLKAAYFATVDDFEDENVHFHVLNKKISDEEGKHEEKNNGPFRSGQTELTETKNEVDLNHNRFQILHAASACMYMCPTPLFQLILKVCGMQKVTERDSDFHLPLHLAVKAMPPAQCSSSFSSSPSPSTSQHEQKYVYVDEDGLGGITIQYNTYTTLSSSTTHSSPMPNRPEVLFNSLLELYPEAASIPDETGKFPLLLALESGKPWSTVIEPLIQAYPTIFYAMDDSKNLMKPLKKQPMIRTATTTSSIGLKRKILISSRHRCDTFATIQASLLAALTCRSATVRKETTFTVGQLMRVWSEDYLGKKRKESDSGKVQSDDPQDYEQQKHAADDFVKTLIKASERCNQGNSFLGNTDALQSGMISDNQNMREGIQTNESRSIQSNMLHALSEALRNSSSDMILVPDTPQMALDMATNLLAHEDSAVRGYAAHVIASALEHLGHDLAGVVMQQIVLIKKGFKIPELNMSNHTIASSIHSTASIQDDTILLKHEETKSKHGRAAVCLRILLSLVGESIARHEIIFFEATVLIKILMADEDILVRRAACLAIGALIGRALDGVAILKDVRHTILKSMRATEEVDLHISLAHGLILASKLNKGVFMSKVGIQILEGALMLSVSASSPSVQGIFHAFLWVALDVGCGENTSHGSNDQSEICLPVKDGLAKYMSLAQGENGKIMMSLVTKTLSKIDSVEEDSIKERIRLKMTTAETS